MTTGKNPNNPSKQDVAQNMKQKADETSRDMKNKGREQLEKQESRAADEVDKVADAAKAAAHELDDRNEPTLSHYVTEIADGIGSLSDNLRNKNTDDLIREASRLAKNNTGLFLLGSVALGFGISRIAKASRSGASSDSEWEDYYGQQHSTSYGAGSYGGSSYGGDYGSSYGTEGRGAGASGPSSSAESGAGASESGRPGGNPTHASTSYLPDEGKSTQNPINPPNLGSNTKPSGTDSAGRSNG